MIFSLWKGNSYRLNFCPSHRERNNCATSLHNMDCHVPSSWRLSEAVMQLFLFVLLFHFLNHINWKVPEKGRVPTNSGNVHSPWLLVLKDGTFFELGGHPAYEKNRKSRGMNELLHLFFSFPNRSWVDQMLHYVNDFWITGVFHAVLFATVSFLHSQPIKASKWTPQFYSTE